MNDKDPGPGKGRRARGFVRAGGLIEPQMTRAAAGRSFAQARLRTLWPDIAGPEFATISAPVKLTRARGPTGGLLMLAVAGAHAPQIQMMIPVLRERVNAALGPGTVGRIQPRHAPAVFAAPDRPARPAPDLPPPDLGPVVGTLSSIGDGELRSALETLARNVVIRARTPKT